MGDLFLLFLLFLTAFLAWCLLWIIPGGVLAVALFIVKPLWLRLVVGTLAWILLCIARPWALLYED